MPYGRWRLGLGWLVATVAVLAPATVHAERVVYINLDQTALTDANGQDPTTNSFTSAGFTPGTISGWDLDEAQRAELMFWFREATVPFDIVFVDERPAVGTYDMLVFGDEVDNGELFDLGCSASIGLSDCDDTNLQNISFMFYGCISEAQQMDMKRVAFYGLTGLGFGWGLENLDASGQIMGSYTLSGLEFGNECTPIDGTSTCAHVGCAMGTQNSSDDLDNRIGARVDDGPPVVAITTPMDQMVVPEDITVEATVEDQFGGVSVQLDVVEAGQSLSDDMPPYSWDLGGVPAGTWTLRVTATDADANAVMQEVVICVGVDECGQAVEESGSSSGTVDGSTSGTPGDDDGDSGTAETDTGGGESTSGEDSDDDGVDPTMTPVTSGGFGGGSAESGCGCTSDAPRGGALVLLALFAMRRRRAAT
jgi:MYXO-CTERM domain-containing protein